MESAQSNTSQLHIPTSLPTIIIASAPAFLLTKDFLQRFPVTMSRVPTLSNGLSPWPRIQIGDIPSNAAAVNERSTFLRLRPDSSRRFSKIKSIAQPRGRASSNPGPDPAGSEIPGRGTSFGSTQEFRDVYGSFPLQRLDRKVSEGKVKELLELRKQKLREAKRKGDEMEVFRLKNLNLFDEIERPRIYEEDPKDVEFCRDFTRQTDHQGFPSQIDVIEFSFTHKSESVRQGHTATLCWHLKLENTQGLTVPDEFSQCTVHPTLSQNHSSSPSSTLQPASPSSLTSESRPSLRHTKVSSIGSSTLKDTSEPSSPATQPSATIASKLSPPSSVLPNSDEEDLFLYIAKNVTTCTQGDDYTQGNDLLKKAPRREDFRPSSSAICSPTTTASKLSSPTKHLSVVPDTDEEDPFLYIAKYNSARARGDSPSKQAKRPRLHTSSANAKRSFPNPCTCTNHNCRTYLSSSPSRHCRFCKLPELQPEIAAAVDRIEETRMSLLVQADANLPAGSLSETDEFPKFEALQEDMELVEMYNAETEKRCRNGVWWEGWLIVEDLKRQGIVGSKPFVYARDDLVA